MGSDKTWIRKHNNRVHGIFLPLDYYVSEGRQSLQVIATLNIIPAPCVACASLALHVHVPASLPCAAHGTEVSPPVIPSTTVR